MKLQKKERVSRVGSTAERGVLWSVGWRDHDETQELGRYLTSTKRPWQGLESPTGGSDLCLAAICSTAKKSLAPGLS